MNGTNSFMGMALWETVNCFTLKISAHVQQINTKRFIGHLCT